MLRALMLAQAAPLVHEEAAAQRVRVLRFGSDVKCQNARAERARRGA